MNADKLRPLAARLEEHAALHGDLANHDTEQAQWERDLRSAAAYLRACADALDAGPVAWVVGRPGGYHTTGYDSSVLNKVPNGTKLYPVAMPAPASATIERLRAALDALGVAIADAGYTWTPEMRKAYHDGEKS